MYRVSFDIAEWIFILSLEVVKQYRVVVEFPKLRKQEIKVAPFFRDTVYKRRFDIDPSWRVAKYATFGRRQADTCWPGTLGQHWSATQYRGPPQLKRICVRYDNA